MIDRIKRVEFPGPADGNNRRSDLAFEKVAIGAGHEAGPFNEGLGFGRQVGEVGGRPRMMPSASTILAMHSLATSSSRAQRPFFVLVQA